jgi:hypothetical protein
MEHCDSCGKELGDGRWITDHGRRYAFCSVECMSKLVEA